MCSSARLSSLLAAFVSLPLATGFSAEREVVKDVVYGRAGDEELKLDYARPRGDGAHPGVLCIHGGGWSGGSRQSLQFLVERLADSGYVAATVSYRFAPKQLFPAQIEDVKAALRWMRANAARLGLDPARIGVVGGSAGGHLALLAGFAEEEDGLEGAANPGVSSRVQAVVNLYGPTDLLSGIWADQGDRTLRTFLGGSLAEKRELYRKASPVVYLTRDDPPVLTFHGTADPLVPFAHAEILHKALAKLGIENRLVVMVGHAHGWGGAAMDDTVTTTIAFFDRHLKARRIDRL